MKKNTFSLLFVLIITQFLIYGQTQVGLDIDGEVQNDQSGWSVSTSNNGNIIAIGATRNDGTGNSSGHVRIFENQSGTWTQIGQDIDGESFNNQSGYSISLSGDGSIVAIGAIANTNSNGTFSGHVRVYENQSGTWVQVGQDIDGENSGDQSGYSVSLSDDGTTVAIGANINSDAGNSSGHVRIFENQSGTWTQIGQDINGANAGDEFGYSVSLSDDGSVVAIGAPFNDSNAQSSGHARIFENQSGTWNQIGQDIIGESQGDQSGWCVNLSGDGSVVAIGANANDNSNGFNSGHVRVYKNMSGNWIQIGQDIDGESESDFSGESVSLSQDGSIVAIGARFNDGNGNFSGHVRVYQNQSGSWVQLGQDIDGEAGGDSSGWALSLSDNGAIVVVGAYLNDGNGSNSGHVRVYDLSALLSLESFEQDVFNVFVNDTEDLVKITLNNAQTLNQVNLYTVDGKYLYSKKTLEFKIDNLSSGIYVIEVETNKGRSAKKVVIN